MSKNSEGGLHFSNSAESNSPRSSSARFRLFFAVDRNGCGKQEKHHGRRDLEAVRGLLHKPLPGRLWRGPCPCPSTVSGVARQPPKTHRKGRERGVYEEAHSSAHAMWHQNRTCRFAAVGRYGIDAVYSACGLPDGVRNGENTIIADYPYMDQTERPVEAFGRDEC